MGMSCWKSQWADLERRLTAAGCTGRWDRGKKKPPQFEIDSPASEREVVEIESQLGRRLPESMRRVMLAFSSRVCIEWALADNLSPPEQFRQIFAGECRWDLKALPEIQRTHRQWIENCFAAKSTPDWPDKHLDTRMIQYDLVWHNKFAFLDVANGDMVGVGIMGDESESVIYLSHEDGPCHGFRLGRDFEDYVDRLTGLAFVGAEDWQQEVFLPDATGGLVTSGPAHSAWWKWLDGIAGGQ